MSEKSKTPPLVPATTILVTGDVIRDIYIYQGDREHPAQTGSIKPHLADGLGGAWFLYELIKYVWGNSTHPGFEEVPPDSLHAMQTLWHACEGGTKKDHEDAPKNKKPDKVWRVGNSLGYGLGHDIKVPPKSPQGDEPHSVMVLDDAGMAFRFQAAKHAWPLGIPRSEQQPEWIILKLGGPVCQGDLWRMLIGGESECARRENLMVIVAADELRRDGAAISRGFSWEQTLNDLCLELDHSPEFQPLLHFPQHLIVTFGCVGAVWFSAPRCGDVKNCRAADRATLVYDPTLPEGGYKTLLQDQHPVYGHLNTFTTAISVTLAAGCGTTSTYSLDKLLPVAMGRGLKACRNLRLLGRGKVNTGLPALPLDDLKKTMNPFAEDGTLSQTMPEGFYQVTSNSAKYQADSKDTWSLAALAENPPDHPNLPLYGLAHRVALYGYSALQRIPHANFGVMLSVDRWEMETLRGISQLIRKYRDAPKPKEPKPEQPLSIAAFGPPGAGKSFGIKEIVKEILGEKVPILEFNLSQFDSPSGLHGAFHQVRDQALKGVTPVVFWDEFDSQSYRWLQYLLAPMQDGVFEENGHTQTIGKCIFVFAGATSWDFAHFGPAPMPDGWKPGFAKIGDKAVLEIPNNIPDETHMQLAKLRDFYSACPDRLRDDQVANDDFRRKKGQDFLSRLDAHIDVLGPNQRMLYDWETRTWITPDPNDITFPVRRALLLRQFLNAKKGNDHLLICRDLLHAFLHAPKYTFSARSLEKVAKPAATNHPPFRRAHLPPPQVLRQHIESIADFDEIYQSNRDFLCADNLNKIAAAIDENYCRLEEHNEAKKATAARLPHTPRPSLSEDEFVKEFNAKQTSADPWQQWLAATNLAAAKRLPWILALVGLKLDKGVATADEENAVKVHLSKHLAMLSEEEHDLWMEFHLANDWRQVIDDNDENDAILKALKEIKAVEKAVPPFATPKYDAEIKHLKRALHRHTLLVPFAKLDDEEKAKDHDSIRNYPETVALVGWKIVFAES